MNENGNIEENVTGISSENVEGKISGFRTLTQEAVNEQIKGFIGPLTRQLEKQLTPLVQELVTMPHPSHSPGLILVPLLVQPLISSTPMFNFQKATLEDVHWSSRFVGCVLSGPIISFL